MPRTIEVITWHSSEYAADGFNWMTLGSRLLRSQQHSKTTSRKQRGPLNCHYPDLRGTQLNKSVSKQSLNQIPFLSLYKSSSINPLSNLDSFDSNMFMSLIRRGGAHSTRISHQKSNNQRELDVFGQCECRRQNVLSIQKQLFFKSHRSETVSFVNGRPLTSI
jgi:hypothetical protein